MAGLDQLYKEIILDHYRNPRNQGELPPPATKTEGFNPLCGDEIELYVVIEDGVVTDISIGGQGCSISQASASMMSTAVKGKSVDDALGLTEKFKAMMSIPTAGADADSEVDEDAVAAAKASASDADLGAVVGDTVGPDREMGELSALQGVKKFPLRIKCATLSWNTLLEAIENAVPQP